MGHDTIIWHDNRSGNHVCPICVSAGKKRLILQVKNPLNVSEYLDLYRCGDCSSCFYFPINLLPKEDYYTHRLIKHVCETAGGIDRLITPLVSIEKENVDGTLLDVGCGLGISVDFSRRILHWDSIGLEPSPMGQVGQSALNVPIYFDYLENVAALKGRRFGVVYASEVIEHVEDPVSLIRTLAGYVSDQGMVLLTTPNAEYIRRETSFPINICILAPVDHLVLFTPGSLEFVLKNIGFRHVTMLQHDNQIVVCASYRPLGKYSEHPRRAYGENRGYYRKYLDELGHRCLTDEHLSSGLAFRRFIELIDGGEYQQAQQCFDSWKPRLIERYGDKILDPEQVTASVESLSSFEDFIDRFPGNLAGLHFYLGLLHYRGHNAYDCAARHFKAAFRLPQTLFRLSFNQFFEDLARLWESKYYEGRCLLSQGHLVAATQVFQQIRSRQGSSSAEYGYAEPNLSTVHQSTHYQGVALLERRHVEEAISCFREVLSLERSQGWNFLTESASQLLGCATGRILREGLELLPDKRQAYRSCVGAFWNEVGSRLSRTQSLRLSLMQLRNVWVKEGVPGLFSRLRKRIL